MTLFEFLYVLIGLFAMALTWVFLYGCPLLYKPVAVVVVGFLWFVGVPYIVNLIDSLVVRWKRKGQE